MASIQWTEKNGQVLSLYFDATLSETHEYSAEPTDHAVEQGSDITDNVVPSPIAFSMEGFVSNAPTSNRDPYGIEIGTYGYPMQLDVPSYDPPFSPTPGAVFSAIGGAVRSLLFKKREYVATVLRFKQTQNYVREVQAQLWKLIDDHTLLTIYTPTWTYEDMVLVKAPLTRRPDQGDAGVFNMDFRQLRIVTSSTVRVPAEKIAKKPKDAGKQVPKEKVNKESVIRNLAGKQILNAVKATAKPTPTLADTGVGGGE